MASDDDGTSTLTITPGDRDAVIRTVIGEAGNQPDLGKAAVAHTIMNRMISGSYGGSPTAVVLANDGRTWQFEPWGTRAGELQAISTSSPQYQSAAKIVDGVLSGDTPDPTNGATNFLNPDTVMQRYGRLPRWASGDGVQIGQHVFLGSRQTADDNPTPDAQSAISVQDPPQPPQGSVPPGILAFAPDGLTHAVDGKPAMPQPLQAPPPAKAAPATPAAISDQDLEALITGSKPNAAPSASDGSNPPPGVRFATPAATPNPVTMSDGDLEKLIVGAPGTSAATSSAPAGQTQLTPEQLASGRDPVTGELVVGGKPFTSDSNNWSGLVNAANGMLQGGGTDLMAAVAALKAKLSGSEPKSLGDLYDQAKSTYQGARQDYTAANPGTAAATEIGGSLATAIPAMAAGGSGLAATGNALVNAARGAPILARAVSAAEAAGSLLAGNAGAGGAGAANLLLRGTSLAAHGAVQGATGAALSSGLSDNPLVDQVRQGAELGAGVGAGLPAVVAAGGGVVNRLLGAGSVSPETAALADTARQYGIPIRPGQLTDSPGVRFIDSTLSKTPGMGYGGEATAQGTALNRAVANTMGETADRITPPVMSAARSRIGAALDDVAARTTIRQDHPLINDLTNIASEAHGVLADSELRPLQTQMQNVLSKFSPSGEMTGEAYQALTRNGAPLDRLQSSDNSNLRFYANRVRDALDDTMERSASPDVLQQLQQARGQYKAMKTIEPLVEKSTTGDVSPAGLMQAVRSSYNGMAYGGGGPLGDLARVGQKFLKDMPSSGTAERLQAQGTAGRIAEGLKTLGGVGMAAAGLREAAPYAAPYVSPEAIMPTLAATLGATGATFAGGRIASQILRSPTVANMLIDRALGNPSVPGPVGNALLSGIGSAPGALPIAYNRLLPPSPTSQMANAR